MEGTTPSVSPPGTLRPTTVRDSWQALADGLHVQRVHLHLEQWRKAAALPAEQLRLPVELDPADMVSRPVLLVPHDDILIRAAGLRPWIEVPQRLGHDLTAAGPLTLAVDEVARELAEGLDSGTEAAVHGAAGASAWWVGVFAVIHHESGRTASLAMLQAAARAVALGTAMRVLRAALHAGGGGNPGLRAAYCRAVAETVVLEPSLPGLLGEIGGMRLTDLVTTSVPWRGQFTKYQSGTGAGQVE
ncbi:hypothetical protein [Peterkaempfera bronchialis]|uniref:Uncharacterized protein n=1 Tax=Peterkaempfera bronchialis TaxID=2126346 RepID=A0A345SXV6_9ACTN|nr:hypothetical protein [Peterkaempfera bronchialis]AXI78561.1 hypothetical protein C7M71_015110 [Peterkaempfera bronchialis]